MVALVGRERSRENTRHLRYFRRCLPVMEGNDDHRSAFEEAIAGCSLGRPLGIGNARVLV